MNKLTFSSKIGSLLAIIGVAIGLGNVWRFPYMMGQYGGSAFLFIYLIFILLFAIPALTGEFALGRFTRSGPVGAFGKAFGPKFGKPFAFFIATSIFIANSYYLLIIANIGYLAFHSGFYGFDTPTSGNGAGLDNHLLQYLISIILLISCLGVIYMGLRKGIERLSMAIVPFFGIVMIYLLYRALNLPGAIEHLMDFIQPNFSSLTAKNVFAAMGQAFFTLSLGGTMMIAYGSYVRDDTNLPSLAASTSLGDLIAALLAALFIVPTILVYNLDMEQGPTLLFSTIPHIFSQMPNGRVLGTLFLLALLLVSFLSSLAVLQLYVRMIFENSKLGFTLCLILVGIAQAILIIPSAFNPSIISTLDLIFGSGMQMLGSCLAIIALCWGLGKGIVMAQMFTGKQHLFQQMYFQWLKWIVPAALVGTLILYLYDSL
ncbi:MAG: hypothetical protein COB85_08355 [Bacteroidetes bacterium]|nr:MAG: hypothetical protein COB85_08355 [Bacteroidota bacterium]